MGISFGSINTGLPKDIVQQLMKAERIPIKRMEGRKKEIVSKKKLVENLIGLAKAIRNHLRVHGSARSIKELKATYNNNIIDIIIDKNKATPGNYQFQVDQLAQKSSMMTSGVEDPVDSYLGVGYIKYYLPNGDVRDIYVDSDNSSLKKIASLINKDKTNGMRASVINDGSGSETPWRLIISLEETGKGNRAEFPDFYFVDGKYDFFIESEREAQNALIYLDGFEIEIPKNSSSELIPGVSIDFKKASPGEEFSIGITEDIAQISKKIKELVDKINSVLSFIVKQNTLDENSDTSKSLGGEIMLQTLEGRIRNIVFQDIPTDFGAKKLNDIGVSFQRNGLLIHNQRKFEVKSSKNYKMVEQILTGLFTEEGKIDGFMDRLKKIIDFSLRSPNGILHSRRNGLQTNIKDIDKRISDKERFLGQKENALKEKYARLEATVSKIRSSGAGLSALGASTPSPVQQLG